jgi:hypothetical protein
MFMGSRRVGSEHRSYPSLEDEIDVWKTLQRAFADKVGWRGNMRKNDEETRTHTKKLTTELP